MMRTFIIRLLATIISTVLLLFFIAQHFVAELGFVITPSQIVYTDLASIIGLIILGTLFWVGITILKPLVKLITLPIAFFTLGASNIIVNIGILYLIQYITQYEIQLGYTIELGNVFQTLILSVILSILLTVIDRILKKIF